MGSIPLHTDYRAGELGVQVFLMLYRESPPAVGEGTAGAQAEANIGLLFAF